MSRAFVFPGQGAQAVGMGAALADGYPAARAVFDEVDAALGEKLSRLIREGPADELTLTANAQPALMATSMAAMKALEAEGVAVTAAAYLTGHSLGEYTALCAGGALSLADTARLLRLRGQAMQDAVPVGQGAMAALLGIGLSTAREIAHQAAHQTGGTCEAANDNEPLQVVVSGDHAAVERATELAGEHGARRAMMLPVSAPFHCELMRPAAARMAEALSHVDIAEPRVPVVANVLAHDMHQPGTIRSILVDQVTHAVRWRESVAWMIAQGVEEFWEIGAGKALSGMIRRIDKTVATLQVATPDEVRAAAARAG